jgi:4-amino-4-deoxy-L-arabinose transferase-like glycosyltransferase
LSEPEPDRERLDKNDWRNLALIIAGFVVVLVVVSPARAYPMYDDWAYAQATRNLANGLFVHHDWIVATALVPQALGALMSSVFGFSFTTLTIVGIGFGLLGVVSMYLLLRQVRISPGISLLGAATLGLNPMYVLLSYSFMTDIPFVALVALASLLLMRGLGGEGEGWLWLGSIAVTLAYLTRQHGILLAVGALGYLWWSRQWSWRRAAGVGILPLAAFVAYTLWENSQPMRLELYLEAQMQAGLPMWSAPWFGSRLQMLTWVLAITGLSVAPVLRPPRRLILALVICAALLAVQVRSVVAGVSLFPENGSVIDHTGFSMFGYNSAPVLAEWVWTGAGFVGAALASLQLAHLIERAIAWLRSRGWQHRAESHPILMLYASGTMMAVAIFSLTPFVFDRYILPILPLLVVCALRGRSAQLEVRDIERRETRAYKVARWAGVGALAVFSLVALRDYKEHAGARWAAGEGLLANGVTARQIYAGIEWMNWHLYEEGVRNVRASGDYTHAGSPASALVDPVYVLSDQSLNGYSQTASVTYSSWLGGWTVRQVLVLRRKD